MASLTPTPKFQFVAANGDPLFSGKVYTYAAGTTTPLATYTDAGGGTANTNPVILDAYGSANIWLGAAAYKIVVKNASDATIYTVDNVRAPVASGTTGLFSDGTVSAPGIGFVDDTNTGIYRVASPVSLSYTLNGTVHSRMQAEQFLTQGGFSDTPGISFVNDTDTGFYSPNANQLAVVAGGLSGGTVVQWDELGATYTLGQILCQQATTATAPQYSFGLSPTTGMYRSAADEISFTEAGVKRFTMTSDGRLYGTALHNNAGAVTGTTNQYIASGTYTPSATLVANCDAVTPLACQWMRVGNVVTVSGALTADPTVSGNTTTFRLTLPIASDFTNAQHAGGASVGVGGGVTSPFRIIADSTNNEVLVDGNPATASSQTHGFSFTYVVL